MTVTVTTTTHCDRCGDVIRPEAFRVCLAVKYLNGTGTDFGKPFALDLCAPCWWGYRNTFKKKGVY